MVVLTMFEALSTKLDVSGEGVQSQCLFAGMCLSGCSYCHGFDGSF